MITCAFNVIILMLSQVNFGTSEVSIYFPKEGKGTGKFSLEISRGKHSFISKTLLAKNVYNVCTICDNDFSIAVFYLIVRQSGTTMEGQKAGTMK